MPVRGIASLVDSDMEDVSNFNDENSILSIEPPNPSPEPSKKKGGRPKGSKHRVTKPKTAAPKQEGDGVTKRANKPSASKRKALEEHINGQVRENYRSDAAKAAPQNPDDSVMADAAPSDDELESPRTLAQEKKAKVSKPKERAAVKAAPKFKADTRRVKPASNAKEPKLEDFQGIPDTQAEERISEPPSDMVPRSGFKSNAGRGIRFDRPIRNDTTLRHRMGSVSDSERTGGDPQLRRKLGDMTRKFESIELKYRNLREAGVIEANANVEKLKKQCEATTSASNELVTSLKKELSMQTSMAQEYRKLQNLMHDKDAENAKLISNVSELTVSLASAQNEIKALQAKLAASRTAATSVESTHGRTPGSAMKTNVPTRTVMVGSAEAAQAAQNAQLKEDLYSDLTGLIIRGVKRTEEEDMFDCIQTGRNGTLHFKLAIAHDDHGKPMSFEDTEFLYMPLLDSNRDRDLLEMLPDYLTEDITFSRQHAAKFYSRVVDTLTRKKEEE